MSDTASLETLRESARVLELDLTLAAQQQATNENDIALALLLSQQALSVGEVANVLAQLLPRAAK